MADFNSEAFGALLAAGRQRGYLTYAEVNAWLGDEGSPEAVERLLQVLETEGVELIDDADVPDQAAAEEVEEEEDRPPEHPPVGDPGMHRAFMDEIIASPDDDGPRLIYADWLEEQGSAWGEYIRVQCALARTGEDDPAREALEERAERLADAGWWEPPAPEGIEERRHARGLVERATVRLDWFLDHVSELFRWAPVRRLQLTAPPGLLLRHYTRALARVPDLTRLVELDLDRLRLMEEHLEDLASSPHLANLTGLGLRHLLRQGSTRAVRLLAESEFLRGLTDLDLRDCEVQDEDLPLLLAAPFATRLTRLLIDEDDLEYAGITDAGLRALAAAPLGRLRCLSVAGNRFTAGGIGALAHSATLTSLAELDLGLRTDPGGDFPPCPGVVENLAVSPLASRLVSLDLCGHEVGTAGISTLSRVPLPRLSELRLQSTRLGDEGVTALLGAPWLAHLRALDLRANSISAAGLRRFVNSPRVARLTRLDLRHNSLDAEAVRILLASPSLSPRARVLVGPSRAGERELVALARQANREGRCRIDVR